MGRNRLFVQSGVKPPRAADNPTGRRVLEQALVCRANLQQPSGMVPGQETRAQQGRFDFPRPGLLP